MRMKLKGIPASPGVVIGKVYLFDAYKPKITKYQVVKAGVEKEVKAFRKAVDKTHREIEEIKEKVHEGMGERYADIFGAHLLVLEDPFLIVEVTKKIREERTNAEHALWEVMEDLTSNFTSLEDEYLRERAADIHDIGQRILENLIKSKRASLTDFEEDVVVVAHSLAPSDTAQMHKEKVIGFATDVGARTSHTAIMARALEIPAVVGLREITSHAADGDTIIIDGIHGDIFINPAKDEIEVYKKKRKEYFTFVEGLAPLKELPAQTRDGHRVRIMANLELHEEVEHVRDHGAEGIGLYRTEFLFLNRPDLPSEDEQFETYREAARIHAPNPVTIRTLDIGGDKFIPHLIEDNEINPFLGLRAIRLCLANVDIFKDQLSAILRASAYGNLKIIFPMITNASELIKAKSILQEVRDGLSKRDIPFDEKMELGAMIETPSAALTADILAREVDFFSIGTNDLIQYTLAVDRANEKIAHLYEPSHPAILKLVNLTITTAHRNGKWVAMCGEMAANPLFTVILLGLGLDEFSMSGMVIPEIKEVIRSVTLGEARDLANESLNLERTDQIKTLVKKRLGKRFEDILEEVGEV